VLFFALVLLLSALARPGDARRENISGYIFTLSTVGLAFVLYLAWASFFQLKAVCLLCVTTYVAVIAIFIISGGATKLPMTTLPRRAARDAGLLSKSPVALLTAVLFIGGAAALISFFPREGSTFTETVAAAPQYPPLTDAQRADFERWWDVQPKVDMPVDPEGAKVVIVKFNDFQCPPCRLTYNEYRGIIAKYTAAGQVKYVLKHFPLDPECNPSGGQHFAACEAAAGYVMARPKGTSEKLEAWFFANQPTLTAPTVKQGVAQVAGISDFDAQYPAALAQVRADIEQGVKVGVNSTPTFFINGRKVGAVTGQAFEAAIELELKRSR
jgi:predicted DsbA family dithiol-disulfide isomerase